jgi:large subunit ribosomal protein L25
MAEQAKLQVQMRTVLGKAVKQLRRQGVIPANLTGRHSEPVAIQVDRTALERFMKAHGRTTLIGMAISGAAEQTAMIAHVQREPVSGKIQHVDFLQVEMNQPMKVRVPIHVEGEAPAVKNGDGILLHLRNDIEVEALPSNLPEALTIDVSALEKVDDAVYVRDLKVPPRVQLVHMSPDEPLIKVAVTRAAIEEAAGEAAPAAEGEAEASASAEGKQGTPTETKEE